MNDMNPRVSNLSHKRKELFHLLTDEGGGNGTSHPVQSRQDGFQDPPLSSVQERIWFLCQLPEDTPYPNNLPSAVNLKGPLDANALEKAFNKIVARHESLRTTFPTISGKPVQHIAPALFIPVSIVDLQHLPEKERKSKFYLAAKKEIQGPFDITKGPLIRIHLYRLNKEEHLLLLIAHHIIWDGWSIGLFTRELNYYYGVFCGGKETDLPFPSLQYADFAIWQQAYLKKRNLGNLISFWEKTVMDVPDLELPTDYPRPIVQNYHGSILPVLIPEKTTIDLLKLSQQQDTTLFMTLLAVFNILLFKYSGNEKIIIGSPTANRMQREVEGIIGCFANIFVLQTQMLGNPNFYEILERVKQTTLAAQAHQDLPFEMIVEQLKIEHDPGKNPLFQVMFGLHQTSLNEMVLEGLTVSSVPMDSESTHFDLGLHLWIQNHNLSGYFSYRKDLFRKSTIESMLFHFEMILSSILVNPLQKISQIDMLTLEEKERFILKNDPANQIFPTPGIHEQFEGVARRAPDAIALLCPDTIGINGVGNLDETISYADLNRYAQRFAQMLCERFPEGQIRAAFCLDPCPEYVIGMLGVLKAGGVIVPIDPATPVMSEILENTGVNILITHSTFTPCQNNGNIHHFLSDALLKEVKTASLQKVDPAKLHKICPEHPAFLFYSSTTSFVVSHQRMGRCLDTLQDRFNFTDTDVWVFSKFQNPQFMVWQLLWPLLSGGGLAMPAETGSHVSRDVLLRLFPGVKRQFIHFTPTSLEIFLADKEKNAQGNDARENDDREKEGPKDHILVSGGRLNNRVVTDFIRIMDCELTYLYSPFPAAFEVGFMDCRKGDGNRLSLGKSTCTHILDPFMKPVPFGMPGDIYISAKGLAPIRLVPITLASMKKGKTAPDFLMENLDPIYIRTHDRGRLFVDEAGRQTLALGPSRGFIWKNGTKFRLCEVENYLMASSFISDCHVISHRFRNRDCLIAFVVPRNKVTLTRMCESVKPYLPQQMMPDMFLPVNQIPLTRRGTIDEKMLTLMDIPDQALIHQWESAISSIPGIDQVKVFWKNSQGVSTRIHISNLIPQGQINQCITPIIPLISEESCPQRSEDQPQAMAFSDGGPLSIPKDAPKTLGSALLTSAGIRGHNGIVIFQDESLETFLSYATLLKDARSILTGLKSAGLNPRDAVILQIADMEKYFSTFWACILGGIIPVTITQDTSYTQKSGVVKKLWNTWTLLEGPPIITDSDLVAPVSGVPALYGHGASEFNILVVEDLKNNLPAEKIHDSQPEEPAFFQLTSGSTGIPKCVQITHAGAIHYIHGALSFGNTDKEITLNWLPMDHVVPLLTCHLKDVYLGNQQIQIHTPRVLANPLLWLDLLEIHGVTYTWSPNFGFKLLSDALSKVPDKKWDLSKLKFVLTGGEQITLPVIAEIHKRLAAFGMNPDVMRSGYGMAEIGTVAVHPNILRPDRSADSFLKSSLDSVLQESRPGDDGAVFMNLGPARAGVQFRIVTDENQLVAEKIIGNLQVRGGCVTPGYFHNETANQEVFTPDGWFNTGDCAFIRNGILTVTGRVKETIIICGANYYCYEIEDIVNDINGVEPTFSGACAVDDPVAGSEGLAVFFVPKSGTESVDILLIRSIREKIGVEMGISPAYVIPLPKTDFPKTTSGKIQRSDLKKALMAGNFDLIIKEIDLALKNANTLPEWFFNRVWIQKRAKCFAGVAQEGTLVFTDDTKIYQLLATQLEGSCIQVESGDVYATLSPTHYRIHPGNASHYESLLTDIFQNGVRPNQILHFFSYTDTASPKTANDLMTQISGHLYSLLYLSQAMSTLSPVHRPKSLQVFSNNIFGVDPEDEIALEKSPLPGLMKTISLEYPDMNCHLIDLPHGKDPSRRIDLLRCIPGEVSAYGDPEVAYRNGIRYVPKFKKTEFKHQKSGFFEQGEVILISGGLGGVGVEIARFLLTQFKSRLILIGKTSLAKGDIASLTVKEATGGTEDGLAQKKSLDEKIQSFIELQGMGEVIYEAADVGNPLEIGNVIERAQKKWKKKLSGVIHLAGVLPTRLLTEETSESFTQTLYPKVAGAKVLGQFVPKTGFFIGFGSLFSFFGGLAVGAYASANAFLEGFTHHLRRTGISRSYCFSWTNWEETGMSRGFNLKDQSRELGYYMIPVDKGIISLLAGLYGQHHQLMVGLDACKPAVQSVVLHPKSLITRKLVAGFTTKEGSVDTDALELLDVRDPSGNLRRCEFVHLPKMPLTPSGEIDLAALQALSHLAKQVTTQPTKPRTSYERTIQTIWQEVLDIDEIGIHDTFFELGGQSILLVRTQTKLQQMFNQEISIVELLRYPTINTLAKYLEEGKTLRTFDSVKSRAKKQKDNRNKKHPSRCRVPRRIR